MDLFWIDDVSVLWPKYTIDEMGNDDIVYNEAGNEAIIDDMVSNDVAVVEVNFEEA